MIEQITGRVAMAEIIAGLVYASNIEPAHRPMVSDGAFKLADKFISELDRLGYVLAKKT